MLAPGNTAIYISIAKQCYLDFHNLVLIVVDVTKDTMTFSLFTCFVP